MPDALTCAEAFRRLDDYLDRELAPDDVALVESHLATCEACADEFAVEQDLLDQLRAKLAQIKGPPGLLARISDRLRSG